MAGSVMCDEAYRMVGSVMYPSSCRTPTTAYPHISLPPRTQSPRSRPGPCTPCYSPLCPQGPRALGHVKGPAPPATAPSGPRGPEP